MRIGWIGAIVLTLAATAAIAQTGSVQPAPKQDPTGKDKPITLSGCVQSAGEAGADEFTLSDTARDRKRPAKYRLSGADVRQYVGRRVRIVGGLMPSANAAAQAGALDPVQSALAMPGRAPAGTGTVELPEVLVRSVKPLGGTCPPQ